MSRLMLPIVSEKSESSIWAYAKETVSTVIYEKLSASYGWWLKIEFKT